MSPEPAGRATTRSARRKLKRKRSLQACRDVALGFVTASVALQPGVRPASAYVAAVDMSAYGGVTYYKIAQSAGDLIGTIAIYAGEQAWKIDGQGNIAQFYNDNNANTTNLVYTTYIDGSGGILALASQPCYPNAGCFLKFDNSENWYTGTATPANGQIDAWTVAAMEFGHWVGTNHADALPTPSTDPSTPTSNAGYIGIEQRNISQDDANGFRRVRSSNNVLANNSYEITTPFYGWKFMKASGSNGNWARYCNSLRHSGSCFVQFNGNGHAGSSIYQDLVDTGFHGTNNWPDVSVWLATDASTAQTVDLTVWNLDTNTSQLKSCSVPAGGGWSKCSFSSPFVKSSGMNLRFQIYNEGTHNISVDDAQFH